MGIIDEEILSNNSMFEYAELICYCKIAFNLNGRRRQCRSRSICALNIRDGESNRSGLICVVFGPPQRLLVDTMAMIVQCALCMAIMQQYLTSDMIDMRILEDSMFSARRRLSVIGLSR